uniref:Uncharacterized protein n=1 Tax=Anguilla anguilla TaxID=7936 RepID=A0A0E9V0C7_ANGAN
MVKEEMKKKESMPHICVSLNYKVCVFAYMCMSLIAYILYALHSSVTHNILQHSTDDNIEKTRAKLLEIL